jgi:hypothetical protein
MAKKPTIRIKAVPYRIVTVAHEGGNLFHRIWQEKQKVELM